MRPIILKPKKSIDGDPIAYLIDLVISFSKILTKGRGLSRNGVNALLLFVLTAGLLYQHTNLPTNTWEIIKLYLVPLIFLTYFFVDMGRKIGWITNFFKKLSQKTDFVYENIMDGSISHDDLELYLTTLSFSYEQITEIIKKLIHDGQFTAGAQNSLLQNEAIYRIDTLPLIKESFINPISIKNSTINIEWVSSATCIFLVNMSGNLTTEYLDKLIEKYKEYPSVLVAIGFHYYYRKSGTDETVNYYIKIGSEFKNSKLWLKIANFSFIVQTLIFFSSGIYFISLNPDKQISFMIYVFYSGILFITGIFFSSYVAQNQFIWSLKKHLTNYDLKDDFIVDTILYDVY